MTRDPALLAARASVDAAGAPLSTNRPAQIAMAIVLALGAIARLGQYAARTSFWSDEAFIYLNIRDLGFRHLLGPLKFSQAAPPGFLWVEKLAALTMGMGEYALRLFPLLAGLAALVAFAWLARKLFAPPVAVIVTALFALADKPIDYCAEVKQYSSDTLFAVLLMLVCLDAKRPYSERLARLAIVAALSIWFSHTSIFIFAAATLWLSLGTLARSRRGLSVAILANGLVAVSFITLYLASVRKEHDDYLYEFWAPGFPPHTPGGILHASGQYAQWLVRQGFDLAQLPYRNWGLLVAALSILGIVSLATRRAHGLLALAFGPIVLVVLAACLRQYPFTGSRLTLFLVPGICLLIGAGLAELRSIRISNPWLSPSRTWWIAIAPILFVAVWQATHRFFAPRYHTHVRPAVEYVQKHRRPDEPIYFLGNAVRSIDQRAEGGRHFEYLCYWPDPPGLVFNSIGTAADSPAPRFWIVVPLAPDHRLDPIALLLTRLKPDTRIVDRLIVKQGGAAILFQKK